MTRKPTWSSVQDQEANVVITTGPESQRCHHCRTMRPTWSSLQVQEANVFITAEPESKRGHHYRPRKPTWSSLQEQKANVVITTRPESQRGHQYRTRKPAWSSLQDQKTSVVKTAGPENPRDQGDVCCPFKIIRYLQSKVWVILHLLQDVTTQIVVSLALVFYTKYVTFLHIEAHSPILGPYFQFLPICLKDCVVLLCPDVSIKQAVIGKKSD